MTHELGILLRPTNYTRRVSRARGGFMSVSSNGRTLVARPSMGTETRDAGSIPATDFETKTAASSSVPRRWARTRGANVAPVANAGVMRVEEPGRLGYPARLVFYGCGVPATDGMGFGTPLFSACHVGGSRLKRRSVPAGGAPSRSTKTVAGSMRKTAASIGAVFVWLQSRLQRRPVAALFKPPEAIA